MIVVRLPRFWPWLIVLVFVLVIVCLGETGRGTFEFFLELRLHRFEIESCVL